MIYSAQTLFAPEVHARFSFEVLQEPATGRWYQLCQLADVEPDSESIHEIGDGRNEDYVSKNFERWKELASLTSREQDPAKLMALAHEINLVLTQKVPYLDPPLHAAGSHEEGQRDVLKANTEGAVCFT